MNFHETGIGQRFFAQQLPALTSQLSLLNAAWQTLTTAMQQPDQALTLPVEAPPDSTSGRCTRQSRHLKPDFDLPCGWSRRDSPRRHPHSRQKGTARKTVFWR